MHALSIVEGRDVVAYAHAYTTPSTHEASAGPCRGGVCAAACRSVGYGNVDVGYAVAARDRQLVGWLMCVPIFRVGRDGMSPCERHLRSRCVNGGRATAVWFSHFFGRLRRPRLLEFLE